MTEPRWEEINGKSIKFKIDSGEIIESLVIANSKIGVSIKPLDAKEVPVGDNWHIPPSDPDFYFICTSATMESNPNEFNHWVTVLSQDKEFFKNTDLSSGYLGIAGACPFS